jgi:hypothetical protein
MKRWWFIGLLVIGIEGLLFGVTYFAKPVQPAKPQSASQSISQATVPEPKQPALSQPNQPLQYQVYPLEQGTAHVVTVPAGSPLTVRSVVAEGVETLENFAKQTGAVAVINAGFFDPENLKSTSYVMQQGQWVADPRQNDRLMQNPNLAPYLDKILDRSEFRRYQCGDATQYAIALHQEAQPEGCKMVDATGAGPRLLPQLALEQEGFLALDQGVVIRDAVNANQPLARSAIGMTAEGAVVLVMVAQKPNAPDRSGVSLAGLAAFMQQLGVVQAMNLDGGGSASLYMQGENGQSKTVFGSVDTQGNPVGRPVKSVLVVQPH